MLSSVVGLCCCFDVFGGRKNLLRNARCVALRVFRFLVQEIACF